MVGDARDFEALLFADDWLSLAGSRTELEDIAGVVLVMALLGYPWNWKKFRGGDSSGWIGYEIDWAGFSVGISLVRAQWLVRWVEKTLSEGRVEVDDLVAVLGRFGFAMGPLDALRLFLAPIFSWAAAVRGGGRLLLPWSIGFLLRFLAGQLAGEGRVHKVLPIMANMGEAFRADAKAEGGKIVIGGWECRNGTQPREARWFSVELTKATAPWAFSRGEPYRTIAALELYGTLLCILAFADGWPCSAVGRVRLAGTTDNLGNSYILSRLMSTKFPMLPVLGELAVQLMERRLSLELEWAPRLQN